MLNLTEESMFAAASGALIGLGAGLLLLDGLAVRFSMGAFEITLDPPVMLTGLAGGLAVGLIGAAITGQHRHAGGLGRSLGLDLRSHPRNGLGRRPDEDQSSFFHARREFRILRQKPIAWMDCACSAGARRLKDGVDLQVAFRRGRAADMHRRIRFGHMFGARIRVRIDRNAAHAHGPRRLHHPAGNFAPVRNQDRVKHQRCPLVAREDRGLPAPGPPGVFRAK